MEPPAGREICFCSCLSIRGRHGSRNTNIKVHPAMFMKTKDGEKQASGSWDLGRAEQVRVWSSRPDSAWQRQNKNEG